MAYISNINYKGTSKAIGGYQLDGQWVKKEVTIFSATTFASKAQVTYSISSVLPNDGYDYEVLFDAVGWTGTTSGSAVHCFIYAGTGTSGQQGGIAKCVTRTASSEGCGGSAILTIKSSDKNVTWYNNDSTNTSGSCYLFIKAYRRMGTNNPTSTNISKIKVKGTTYSIGGTVSANRPVLYYSTLANGVTLAASGSLTYSLSSYLPNDGYDYEVGFMCTVTTGSTSGDRCYVFGCSGSSSSAYIKSRFLEQITRTSYAANNGGNLVLPIRASDKKITISNTYASASCTIYLYATWYRRIGTNNISSQGTYISNVNTGSQTIPLGGYNFDSPWVVKVRAIMDAESFTGALTRTYSLASYLPNDGYDYLVQFDAYSRTGTTSGNYVRWTLCNGTSTTSRMWLGRVGTRASAAKVSANSGIMPVYASESYKVTINVTSTMATGGCRFFAIAYRRLGTNN